MKLINAKRHHLNYLSSRGPHGQFLEYRGKAPSFPSLKHTPAIFLSPEEMGEIFCTRIISPCLYCVLWKEPSYKNS